MAESFASSRFIARPCWPPSNVGCTKQGLPRLAVSPRAVAEPAAPSDGARTSTAKSQGVSRTRHVPVPPMPPQGTNGATKAPPQEFKVRRVASQSFGVKSGPAPPSTRLTQSGNEAKPNQHVMHVPNFNSHQSTWSTTPVQVPHPKGKPPGAVAVSGLDSELDAERQNLLQTSPQLVGYAAKFALMSNIFKQKEKEILSLQTSLQAQERMAKMLKAELMQTKALVADARQAAADVQLQLQEREAELAAMRLNIQAQAAENEILRQQLAVREEADEELGTTLDSLSHALAQFTGTADAGTPAEDQASNAANPVSG